MGSNAVLVSVDTTSATDNDYITLDDVENIKNKVNGVERCSPMLYGHFGRATIDKTATEADGYAYRCKQRRSICID